MTKPGKKLQDLSESLKMIKNPKKVSCMKVYCSLALSSFTIYMVWLQVSF